MKQDTLAVLDGVRTPSRPWLLELLYRQARLRDHNEHALARALGVTVAQLHTLAADARCLPSLGALNARVIGQYLDIPPIGVWILAGKLSPADWFMPSAPSVKATRGGMERILNDDAVSALLPLSALNAPPSVQKLLSALHQDGLEQNRWGPGRLPAILRHIEAVVLRLAQVDAEQMVASYPLGEVLQ